MKSAVEKPELATSVKEGAGNLVGDLHELLLRPANVPGCLARIKGLKGAFVRDVAHVGPPEFIVGLARLRFFIVR